MSYIAKSTTRVSQNSSQDANRAIRRQTEMNLAYFSRNVDEIAERLGELDREWDIERCLETGSSCLSLLGLTLGITRSRKWFILPLVVQGFFLQHGLNGWCPPLALLRSFGVRTQSEIESERYALKALRGDFASVKSDADADEAIEAVRLHN